MAVEGHFGAPRVSSRLVPSRNSGAVNFVADRLVANRVECPRASGGLRVVVITPLISGPQLVVENHLSARAVLSWM
jgi:hypothetical protein